MQVLSQAIEKGGARIDPQIIFFAVYRSVTGMASFDSTEGSGSTFSER